MKKYPKVKDSGIEWIKTIPENWNVKRLKFTTKFDLSTVDRHEYDNEEQVSICHYPQVYHNEIISLKTELPQGTCTQKELEKFRLKKDDVLITKDSETPDDIGVPVYIQDDFKKAVCGYHIAQLSTGKNQILGSFLFRFIQSDFVNAYFETEANGITRFGLGRDSIKSLKIILPSILEQKSISVFLGKNVSIINEQISNNQKLIELLKEKRKAVIKQAITKGLDPTVSMKDSEVKWIGNTPELWKIAQLRFFGKFVSGTGFPHEDQGKIFGDYPFFKVADTNEKDNEIYMNNSENWISEEIRIKLKAKIAPKNSILFPKIGAVLLKNKRRILTTESIFDNNMMAFYPYSKQFKFWYYLFLLIDFKEIVNPGPVPSLSDDKLKEFRIIVPSETEQKIILDFLDIETSKIDLLMINLKNIIEKLQKYRQALISSTVTGKIDVRETVA